MKRYKNQIVRDAMWAWAHYEGSYDNLWGLPGKSSITPVEGAKWLGIPNIIMIRYNDLPEPPFNQYAAPFRTVQKVMWSLSGTPPAVSEKKKETEREKANEAVFTLASEMPNITGLLLDDFFLFNPENPPNWLADDYVSYPVILTITLPAPAVINKVELTQSDWKPGDHRSGRFAVELSADKKNFKQAAQGMVPNTAGATVKVAVPETKVQAVRILILSTHDMDQRKTCGLRRIRLCKDDQCLDLKNCTIQATSHYPGFEAENALDDEACQRLSVPGTMSIEQLQKIRKRLTMNRRKLDLGMTLYTYQLQKRIAPYLECFDIVSLWTWKPDDIALLEENLVKLETFAPGKRILLGLYMWDFNAGRPMPLNLMKQQCELALKWLLEGRIEGMIFLATNIVNLNLEAVNWSRTWIAEVGNQPILLK